MNKEEQSEKETDSKSIGEEMAVINLAKTVKKLYGNFWQIMARSFVGGLFSALGATVGLVLFFGLVLYALNQLAVLPVIGDFFVDLQEFLRDVKPENVPAP